MNERLYRQLYRIRRLEEEVARVYPSDKIQSPVHLSIGQEAISVGVCDVLRADDVAFGSYRSHAMYLAKGGDLKAMVAELYGKLPGCAKGKAGSMHLIDTRAGVMGASAVVATTIPQAVGYALAIKMRREDRVVVCFFGEGASEEGAFHESLNFAQLKKLPVLFVCENNFFAIHSRTSTRQSTQSVTALAQAHGLVGRRLEKMDLDLIRDTAQTFVNEIRAGAGPRFMECCCYRWMEHVGPARDFAVGYREETEAEPWFREDAVISAGEKLAMDVRRRIEAEVDSEIRAAFDFAEQAPFPPESELMTDLYSSSQERA